MAVTTGQGNPRWSLDETLLSLNLYFECDGKIPSKTDKRIIELSNLLRSLPYHKNSSKKDSFRNTDGVVFKLQNLRSVATGHGLQNYSKMDEQVWKDYGNRPELVKSLSVQIKEGIEILEFDSEIPEDEVFHEGRILTTVHKRRERSPKLRKKFLKKRGSLKCDICDYTPDELPEDLRESVFEVHHIKPISVSEKQITKLEDVSLLCANCHRLIHRLISKRKTWISIEQAKSIIQE